MAPRLSLRSRMGRALVAVGAACLRHLPLPRLHAAQAAARPCGNCGHHRHAHQHYRPGTECAFCGCPRYRQAVAR